MLCNLELIALSKLMIEPSVWVKLKLVTKEFPRLSQIDLCFRKSHVFNKDGYFYVLLLGQFVKAYNIISALRSEVTLCAFPFFLGHLFSLYIIIQFII